MSALPPVLARLPISAFPPATAFNPTDIALFTQGSTGPGTGTTRKLLASQIFGAPIPIGDITPNTGAFTALSGLVTATGSPTARTMADRAADWINAPDFGVKLDGTTSATAGLLASAAAANVLGGNVVHVPRGGIYAPGMTAPAEPTLWVADGTVLGTGTTPLALPGVVENWLSSDGAGRKRFTRTLGTSALDYATVEVARTLTHTGGAASSFSHNLVVSTTTNATASNGEWNLLTRFSNNSPSVLGVSAYVYGEQNVAANAGTSQGLISFIANYTDNTGLPNPAAPSVTMELDQQVNGSDLTGTIPGTTSTGYRSFIHAAVVKWTGSALAPEVSRGLWFSGTDGGPGTRLYSGVLFTDLDMNVGVDLSYATFSTGGPAIRLGAGQSLEFNGEVSTRRLSYVTADAALEYKVAGTARWSVSDAGIMSASALATGGTTARTLAAIFADQNNVKSFGAVGNGTAVDLAALTSAPMPAYLPEGVFYTGASIGALPAGRYTSAFGGGRLQTLESGVSRQGARDFAVLSSAPTRNAGYSDDGQTTAFDADFSASHLVLGSRITGAATLGQPASGYYLNPPASMTYFNMVNTSGWNQETDGNDGRTGVAMQYMRLSNSGQGDARPIYFNSFVNGAKPGATSFLANPSVGTIGGQVVAGRGGVFLQGIGDIVLDDNGNDVAGIGLVLNFKRSVGTGALGATWMAIRPQSQGTVAIDAFYSAGGPARIGFDFTGITLKDLSGTATKSAITLAAGQAIYGNAINSDLTKYARYTSAGTEWLSYETASGWNLVIGSNPVMQASAAGVVRKTASADQSADVFVATAAGSRTIPNGCSWECLTPAATIATFTTTMPAAPLDKQEVWISTTNTITAWTLSANAGQTINGAPTTLAANTSVMFRYNLATTAWFRMV